MKSCKRFLQWLLIVAIIAWLALFATELHAAVVWQSYSDSARTIQSDNFTEYGCWVYMKATGLVKNKHYYSHYFDGAGTEVASEDFLSDGNGTWLGQVRPSSYPVVIAGTWRADLYNWSRQLVATAHFTVLQSAIPEISDVVSAVVVGVTCLGIYLGVRKKCLKK